MNLRYFFFINLLTVFLLSQLAIAQSDDRPAYKMSLKECVSRALRNNEEIKAAHYDVLASVARKVEATKRYVPVVNYRYRVGPVPRDLNNVAGSIFSADISVFNSIKIDVGVPVSYFGRLGVSKELADIGIDASRLQKHQKANEVILDIYKLYHGIVLARELKVLAFKGLDAVQSKIKELEKEEATDQLQILKLKAVLYQIEKKLDEAHKKETIALAMLKFRVGLEDDVKFNIKTTYLRRERFPYKSYKALLAESKDKRPEFKLLNHQVNAKYKQLQLEKKEYYPKLIFGTSFELGRAPGIRGDEGDNAFLNPLNFTRAAVGFELSSELDFRKIKSKVDKAKAEHLKAIAQKRSNYRLLEIDLKNAFLDLEQKRKLLWRAEKEKRSARQVVFLTKSNLDIGLGEKKDYLEALQSYLLVQAAVHETIFKYNLSVATIKSKVGQLYDGSVLDQYGIKKY